MSAKSDTTPLLLSSSPLQKAAALKGQINQRTKPKFGSWRLLKNYDRCRGISALAATVQTGFWARANPVTATGLDLLAVSRPNIYLSLGPFLRIAAI